MNLSHPLVQSVLAPLLASLAVLLVSRFAFGGRLAAAAIGAGLLATLALLAGGFDWPPHGAVQKLAWLVAMLLGAGMALELAATGRRALAAVATALLAAGAIWLGSTRLVSDALDTGVSIAVVVVVAALLSWRFSSTREAAALPALTLSIAAAGLAAVVFNGGSLVIAQLGIGLAVASAVLCAVALLVGELRFGAVGLLAGLGAWVLLVTTTIMLTETSRLALAALLPVFVCDLGVGRLGLDRSPFRHCLWVALAGLPSVLLAVALAIWLKPAQSLYYQ